MSALTESELILGYRNAGWTPAGKVAAEVLGWPNPCPCRSIRPPIGALESAIDAEARRRRKGRP